MRSRWSCVRQEGLQASAKNRSAASRARRAARSPFGGDQRDRIAVDGRDQRSAVAEPCTGSTAGGTAGDLRPGPRRRPRPSPRATNARMQRRPGRAVPRDRHGGGVERIGARRRSTTRCSSGKPRRRILEWRVELYAQRTRRRAQGPAAVAERRRALPPRSLLHRPQNRETGTEPRSPVPRLSAATLAASWLMPRSQPPPHLAPDEPARS